MCRHNHRLSQNFISSSHQWTVSSSSSWRTGHTDLIKHNINTGDSPPIRQRAYRTEPRAPHTLLKLSDFYPTGHSRDVFCFQYSSRQALQKLWLQNRTTGFLKMSRHTAQEKSSSERKALDAISHCLSLCYGF
ncbi:unnamed protein product [Coregonus sp. 'balchen']|nr:unnamed protein product [Coregonus sp. 'balchen']